MQPVLSDVEVTQLANLGLAIEQHYGSPQDTEWSFDPDGNVWMLQSRPITTIAPADHPPDEVLVRGLGAAPGKGERQRATAREPPRHHDLPRRRSARDAHDDTRLGAADAPRRRDRHRLGRDDLSRGDRLARAAHPLRRRHRRSDQDAPRRRARHGRRDTRNGARGRGRARARRGSDGSGRGDAGHGSRRGPSGHRHAPAASTSQSPPRSS